VRLLGLAALLLLITLVSLAVGRYPLRPAELLQFLGQELTGRGPLDPARLRVLEDVLLHIRLPRVAAALLIGAALSTSGAAYQGLLVNPLVSPGLLGVLHGASFGAALGLLLLHSWPLVQLATVAGGVAAVLLALAVGAGRRGPNRVMLVLGGILSGSLFLALVSVVKYLADPYDQLPAIVYWLMGNLAMADGRSLAHAAPIILLALAGLLLSARSLDALSMGEDEARALGIDARRVRWVVIACATAVSTVTVALAGVIDSAMGGVGLLVPHVARAWVGPRNGVLLPVTALLGAIYLLCVDGVARMAFRCEIPVGILTALLGVPVFAVALRRTRQGWT
jgi:iron complex transport system permease protein